MTEYTKEIAAAEAAQAEQRDQQTITEMVRLLTKGEVYKTITDGITELENTYRKIGAVIRLGFDLPALSWAAYISVYFPGEDKPCVRYTNVYGGHTAVGVLGRVARAFAEQFWINAPTEKPCPKCNGLGVECYADPVDNDYHLRACDCPVGRAKKYEVEEVPIEARSNKLPEKTP